jgi:LmbE family N-acetylglucosaminyl deacetylase
MKKLLKYALDLNNLRKTLGFNVLTNAMKSELRLQTLNNPSDLLPTSTDHANILVLSPHPDDDIFAIGGILHKFKKNGDNITILYFCDGSKGTPEGIRDSSLITKRKKESKDAEKVLGISNLIFWGYKDGQLALSRTSMKALYDLILETKPNIIFLPSLIDDHPDHRAACEIFYYAFFKYPEKSFNFPVLIAEYELWTPIFPNRVIDISDAINIKKEAILCHKTQLKSRSYDKAVISLNSFRAAINNMNGYAEAIFISNPSIYKKIFEKNK